MDGQLKTWYVGRNLDRRKQLVERMSVQFRAALGRLIPHPAIYFDTGRSRPMVHLRCATAHVLHSHYQLPYPTIAAITGRTGHSSIYESDQRWLSIIERGETITMPPDRVFHNARDLESAIVAALEAEGFGK